MVHTFMSYKLVFTFSILIKISMAPPQHLGGGGHLPQMLHPGSAIATFKEVLEKTSVTPLTCVALV